MTPHLLCSSLAVFAFGPCDSYDPSSVGDSKKRQDVEVQLQAVQQLSTSVDVKSVQDPAFGVQASVAPPVSTS